MIINNNLNAMNAHRQMGINVNQNGNAMEKLSSGLRINRAGDDAAGLAISEKMRGQIRGLDQASRNSQDGISLIQTAEGALNETHDILQRMRELAVQSANDTNTDEDRSELQEEFNQLAREITRIADNTEFNTQNLLNGDGEFTFHIGANEGQSITLNIDAMDATTLAVATGEGEETEGIDISTQAGADAAITLVNTAIETVSTERSKLGAVQNRLEHTIKNLDNASENLQAAESRIRDVDMAKEMMEFTRTNILNQASQAMLAQANQQPQAVLQLLR
ncbi:flagellin [Alkalihalobacillus sp. MEB130]|uniref:flagellin N-terminal helical domain-containing protein n=1 Tax=Alkalihalobacillus sp. MEB130 TaxID=2976704 RepID=UPI0028E078C6|nr:flagellin [Alkalihalobacillus sp. MEB130]MDT8858776.1 flagellin [Alkalihalobacillus sp. MEB130]